MIKPMVLFVVALAALSVVYATSAGEKTDPMRQSLGEEEYRACGLDQLSSEQADRLYRHVRPGSSRSYLSESAQRYMESNGWQQIEVLGVREVEDRISSEIFLVINDNYEILFLDPWGGEDNLPSPGIYWAKNSLSSWEILMPDGKDRDFLAKDLD